MANKNYTVNIDSAPIIEFLKEKKAQLNGDFSKLMKVARVYMKNTINENFETEGKNTGEKWAPWQEKYKLNRPKGKILSLMGHLRRDMRAKSGKDYAQILFNKEYAAIHNFGGDIQTKYAKIKMPKREYARLDDYAKEELLAELYISFEEMFLEGIAKNK